MPNFNKSNAPTRANSKSHAGTAGRSGAGSATRKPGSRSPKHRGYRPEEPGAAKPKKRLSADERAARPGKREISKRGVSAQSADRRAVRGADSETPAKRSRPDRRPDWHPEGRRSKQADRQTAKRGQREFQNREQRVGKAHSEWKPTEDVVLEKLEARAIAAEQVDGLGFADLGLGQNIVRELSLQGAMTPFPIQAATIPDVLRGLDVLGRGRTGSGKTIAFGAPLVERLLLNWGAKDRKQGRNPRALILAPTRELALQIDRTIQPIARSVGLFTTQIYGGVPQGRQVTALQRGVDIVIGTPGRIEDLVEQRRLDLSEVTITVIDEADHMCELGFLEPVQRILRLTAPKGQKLLYSATLDTAVASLVDEFLVNPSVYEVAGEDQASSTIDHRLLLIDQREKREIIRELSAGPGKTLIFARTRVFAEELADELEDAGIRSVSLHGDLNQAKRTRNLEKLTSGRVNVLVATDVAARGIHVDDISLVIQADPPDDYKTYLHRSGRTGRAGQTGTVVTLVNSRRRRKMDDLLGRAQISARADFVHPGDEVLEQLAAL
ncbi:MAG: DEAD/DEAH box helicase [Cryobacterium sp.]|nr:DEAD/DEAH box helicase [Cryobacterium sp.]